MSWAGMTRLEDEHSYRLLLASSNLLATCRTEQEAAISKGIYGVITKLFNTSRVQYGSNFRMREEGAKSLNCHCKLRCTQCPKSMPITKEH
jgi:hypothetical protein